jgi:aspartokinase/homoserine dehydrogenase 1
LVHFYAKNKKPSKSQITYCDTGELSGDLQNDKGNLEVKLVSVPSDTALADCCSDFSSLKFTESYGMTTVIQGAGAVKRATKNAQRQ